MTKLKLCADSSPRRRKKLLWLYVANLLVLSLSVTLMPAVNQLKEKTMVFMVADGILFWCGAFATAFTAVRINICRKNSMSGKAAPQKKKLGLIHFFQNREACLADAAMIVAFVGFISVNCAIDHHPYLLFSFLGLLIFTFGMHCMLNGSNYAYINCRVRRD